MEEFAACWKELDDPRTGNAALHDFNEMLVIALCCVLSGGQGAVDMGLYARAKEPFLRGFLKLSNGLPSHDSSDNIVDHCCDAWNKLIDQPWRIMSLGLRDWAHGF